MTIAELYEVCVGEGGMSPEYFAHTLTIYEAELYCRGLRRRERGAWHRARYVSYYAAAPHCKNFTPDKMGKFDWEEPKEEQMSEEEQMRELAALRERVRKRDAMCERERIDNDLFDIKNW